MAGLAPIIKKEFRQIRRDKKTLAILLFIPCFLLLMYGYALNFNVKHIRLGVLDMEGSHQSHELIDSLTHSEYFDQVAQVRSYPEIDHLINTRKILLAIVIPEDFTKRLTTFKSAKIQVIIDGTDTNAAQNALNYAEAFFQTLSKNILLEKIKKMGLKQIKAPLDLELRIWYNPRLETVFFLLPGLIAFIIMITAVISTSLSIVKEIELGSIEQMIVSPIHPRVLILGKTIPYLIISLFATGLILLLSNLVFGIEIKGSILLLWLAILVFLFGALGLGLLISTLTDTQQKAFMVSLFITMLPTMILSGFVFPIKNMPVIIQWITYIIPARYLILILRSIILKGTGLATFWLEFLALVVFALVMIALASKRIRRWGM